MSQHGNTEGPDLCRHGCPLEADGLGECTLCDDDRSLAERDRLRERVATLEQDSADDEKTRATMQRLLEGVALALKGKPGPLTMHGWHDLPKLATIVMITVEDLREQLHRSATVCPKDGCMLWKSHKENHATKDQVAEALAANSHGRLRDRRK